MKLGGIVADSNVAFADFLKPLLEKYTSGRNVGPRSRKARIAAWFQFAFNLCAGIQASPAHELPVVVSDLHGPILRDSVSRWNQASRTGFAPFAGFLLGVSQNGLRIAHGLGLHGQTITDVRTDVNSV